MAQQENEQRNAQAGSQQRERQHEKNSDIHREFSDLGLTKRNEEFMFQLNKQLDEQGIKAEKKPDAIKETLDTLLEAQKKGTTAKQLFGTPTQRANDLIHGVSKQAAQPTTSFWLMAIDNGLMFFNIFTVLFGAMGIFSPKSLKVEQSGTTGITAIILVGIVGGMLFAWISTIMSPQNRKKHNIWYKVSAVVLALGAWILVYFAASLLPNVVNPQLPPFLYIALAVAGFVLDVYLRRRFHIVGGAFGAPAPRNQTRK